MIAAELSTFTKRLLNRAVCKVLHIDTGSVILYKSINGEV